MSFCVSQYRSYGIGLDRRGLVNYRRINLLAATNHRARRHWGRQGQHHAQARYNRRLCNRSASSENQAPLKWGQTAGLVYTLCLNGCNHNISAQYEAEPHLLHYCPPRQILSEVSASMQANAQGQSPADPLQGQISRELVDRMKDTITTALEAESVKIVEYIWRWAPC